MGLVPDKGAVQELASASPDPAFSDSVHAGRPHVAQHGPDPSAGEDGVERGGEVRSPVADHELDPVCMFAEVHDQVTCLLRRPFPRQIPGPPAEVGRGRRRQRRWTRPRPGAAGRPAG